MRGQARDRRLRSPNVTLRGIGADAIAMTVISFKPRSQRAVRKKRQDERRGATLCRTGFHRFEVVDTPFDVRAGRLVTRLRCARCGEERTEAR